MTKNDIIITKIAQSSKAKVTHFRDFSESFIEDLKKSKKDQKIYLQLALEEYEKEKNLENFLLALRTIAIAKGGFTDLAKKTNLNRQSLYKALSPRGNPSLATIDTILNCLGFKLTIQAI
jgi:probable addiction module antidote protein